MGKYCQFLRFIDFAGQFNAKCVSFLMKILTNFNRFLDYPKLTIPLISEKLKLMFKVKHQQVVFSFSLSLQLDNSKIN